MGLLAVPEFIHHLVMMTCNHLRVRALNSPLRWAYCYALGKVGHFLKAKKYSVM